MVESLKKGGFEDLMDSEGWMDALKFKFRLDDMNDVYIPIPLLMDLPSVDNRFLVKGEYNFDAHKDTRKIKFTDIGVIVEKALNNFEYEEIKTYDDVVKWDQKARDFVNEAFAK